MMSLPVPRSCCSDLELDQLILGELDEPERQRLENHVAASPSCDARLVTLRAAQQDWQAQLPPLSSPSTAEASPSTTTESSTGPPRHGARRPRPRRFSIGLLLAVAAAMVVLLMMTLPTQPTQPTQPTLPTRPTLPTPSAMGGVDVELTRDLAGRRATVFGGDTVAHHEVLHATVRRSDGMTGMLTVVVESGSARLVLPPGQVGPDDNTVVHTVDVDLAALAGDGPRTVVMTFLICDTRLTAAELAAAPNPAQPWPARCVAEQLAVVEPFRLPR
jgi:energy-converting hydrogenase Eha subunit A